MKSPLLKHWKAFLGMGVLGNFIPAFLFTKAEMGISSSLTGMLNSLTPLFTLLLGVLLFKAKTGWMNVLGITIGFVGAIGLLMVGKSEDMGQHVGYGFYVVLATICYALSVNIIKKELGSVNAITATVWAMMFIGPLAGIYLFSSTDFIIHLSTKPMALQSLGYISILAIFGTAISVIAFNVLIRNTNALFASSVTYLIPIVAMSWGFFENEAVLPMHFVWLTFILLGIYLVNKNSSTKVQVEPIGNETLTFKNETH